MFEWLRNLISNVQKTQEEPENKEQKNFLSNFFGEHSFKSEEVKTNVPVLQQENDKMEAQYEAILRKEKAREKALNEINVKISPQQEQDIRKQVYKEGELKQPSVVTSTISSNKKQMYYSQQNVLYSKKFSSNEEFIEFGRKHESNYVKRQLGWTRESNYTVHDPSRQVLTLDNYRQEAKQYKFLGKNNVSEIRTDCNGFVGAFVDQLSKQNKSTKVINDRDTIHHGTATTVVNMANANKKSGLQPVSLMETLKKHGGNVDKAAKELSANSTVGDILHNKRNNGSTDHILCIARNDKDELVVIEVKGTKLGEKGAFRSTPVEQWFKTQLKNKREHQITSCAPGHKLALQQKADQKIQELARANSAKLKEIETDPKYNLSPQEIALKERYEQNATRIEAETRLVSLKDLEKKFGDLSVNRTDELSYSISEEMTKVSLDSSPEIQLASRNKFGH